MRGAALQCALQRPLHFSALCRPRRVAIDGCQGPRMRLAHSWTERIKPPRGTVPIFWSFLLGCGFCLSGQILYYEYRKYCNQKPYIFESDSADPKKPHQPPEEEKRTRGVFEKVPDPTAPLLAWCTVTLITLMMKWRRSRIEWKTHLFYSRLNISLNTVEKGRFVYRTMRETGVNEVLYGNEAAIQTMMQAAKVTSYEDPFLRFPEGDGWFINNAVLNVISEFGTHGFLCADQRLPAIVCPYIFAITCEKHEGVKETKIRVMLIREELLKQIPYMRIQPEEPPEEDPDLKSTETIIQPHSPEHFSSRFKMRSLLESGKDLPLPNVEKNKERWRTLNMMARLYNEGTLVESSAVLKKVNIALPIYTTARV